MSVIRTAVTACAAVGLAAALSTGLTACDSASSGGGSPASSTTAAAPLVVTQAWIKTTEGATDPSMTGLFVTLQNTSSKDLTITSGSSDVAGTVEIHEMVMKDGKMVMQVKQGGKVIPAGQTVTMKPGGDHIMLMKLKQPLAPGGEATVTLNLSDNSSLKITAPVKKFTDGNSQYVGTATASPSMSMSSSMTMSPSTMGGMTP